MYLNWTCYLFVLIFYNAFGGYQRTLVWNGGPLHSECEHSADLFTLTRQYVKENVIAVKAVVFNDDVYVITPRLKHGVLATVWLIVRGRRGVEFQAFPDLRSHTLGDCHGIQNAIDVHLDHLGNLWVLDSGVVETLARPRCTCHPKVVVISILLKRLTKQIELSSLVEPGSLLQSIEVEYGLSGKPFVYVSDASRGAILVHDPSGSEWSVVACPPASGLQIALARRGPAHTALVVVRLNHQGILELDTAALRRRSSPAPIRVFGEHTKPVLVLGADLHHVYFRHVECGDALSWDTREPYNGTRLVHIHSPGPRLTTVSVAADPLRHVLLVLDSNYADTVRTNTGTYHRITFIRKL